MKMIGSSVILGLTFSGKFDVSRILENEEVTKKVRGKYNFEEINKFDNSIQFERGHPCILVRLSEDQLVIQSAYGYTHYESILELLNIFNAFSVDTELVLDQLEVVVALNVENPLLWLLDEASDRSIKVPRSTDIMMEFPEPDGVLTLIIRFKGDKNYSVTTLYKPVRITNPKQLHDVMNEYDGYVISKNLNFHMALSGKKKTLARSNYDSK